MRKLAASRFVFKKGEGYYIHIIMLFSAVLLLYYSLRFLMSGSDKIFFYRNLISGIILAGDWLYLTLTRKLRTSVNIGLGVIFIFFTSFFVHGTNNPQALAWILILPLIALYSNEKFFGSVLSVSFQIVFIIIIVLQYLGYIPMPVSPPVYLELMSAYTFCFLITYMYKDIIVNKEKQISHELNFCSLTNLPNRNNLIKEVGNMDKGTLFLINVDDFKTVNNLYGAAYGDKILIEMSERLKVFYSDTMFMKIFKLHADEFAIMLMFNIDKNRVTTLTNNIISRLACNYHINDMDIAITVSIGISINSRDLIPDADIALKTAKECRIPYVIYDRKLRITQHYQQNISKLLQLKSAILNDNIIPFFQPIIDNSDGSIHKYECLARLIDGDEVLSPFHFLEISKKAKYYPEVTRTMLKKSFDTFSCRDVQFSINIDLEDILNKETTELIYSKLENKRIAKNAVFELLESNKIEEFEEVTTFISKVKAMGAKIAIDDFGSGYSNFEYILKLNVDFIKIDASLIKNITEDRNSQIITENIVNFSKKLNIKTIAEFVHSEEVYRKVIELGIDYSQGYHLGKPIQNIK